jgi:hypothetical protein
MPRHTMQTPAGELVWYTWNTSASTSSTASATVSVSADGRIWTAWNGTLGSSSAIATPYVAGPTAGSNAVWVAWNGEVIAVNGITTNQYARMGDNQRNAYNAPRRLTPEQEAANRAAAAGREARYLAEVARVAKAKDRAERLLHEMLTPQQSEELKANGRFHLDVISNNGERRRYQIQRGRHGNVKQVDDHGNVIRSLCVHPILGVPDADTMLAQKLYLEHAEEELLQVANITVARR